MDNSISLENKEQSEEFSYQIIRKDLIEQELSVPVGDDYLFTLEPVKCRWVDDEFFEVFYNGKWQEAYSIDFEDVK